MSKSDQWYEAFFDDFYAQVLGDEMHESRAPADAKTIRRALKLRKGHKILDCPCGLGRITFQLAKLSLDTTGVDFAKLYIQRARRRARKEGIAVRFVHSDMRHLPFDGEFDAVVNWFSSFGYFNDAGNLATAQAAFKALKPGGKFAVEVMNKSYIMTHFRAKHDDTRNNNIRISGNVRWDAKTNRVRDTWIMSKGNKTHRRKLVMRIYNGADIRALMCQAGFRNIKLFANVPLGRFTRHSRRMIAIGIKPK